MSKYSTLPTDVRLARYKVRLAIKRGEIIRPKTCSKCGVAPLRGLDGRTMIQAHHRDYSNPLDVEWLCVDCHRAETPVQIGEKHHKAKLTEAQVIEIKKLVNDGSTRTSLAKRFGVSIKSICAAVNGETWNYLNLKLKE